MRQKIIATGVGIALVGIAAVGAFASQDAVSFNDRVTSELIGGTATVSATETAVDATATESSSVTPTETPDATGTPDATDTPGATDTPSGTSTAVPTSTGTPGGDDEGDDDGGERDIKGIPTSNTNHPPAADPENCEKGEAVMKTTPGGTKVMVPCQAAKNSDHSNKTHGGSHGHGNSGTDDSEDSGD